MRYFQYCHYNYYYSHYRAFNTQTIDYSKWGHLRCDFETKAGQTLHVFSLTYRLPISQFFTSDWHCYCKYHHWELPVLINRHNNYSCYLKKTSSLNTNNIVIKCFYLAFVLIDHSIMFTGDINRARLNVLELYVSYIIYIYRSQWVHS